MFTSNEAGYHEQDDSPQLPGSEHSNLGQNLLQVNMEENQRLLHGYVASDDNQEMSVMFELETLRCLAQEISETEMCNQ